VAVQSSPSDAVLGAIRQAVADGHQVEFDYSSPRGDREHRRVDPLRIESVDADWYLRGWCHLRQAVRTFRLDRIAGLVATTEPISHRASDVQLPDTLFQRSDADLVVTVDVAPGALALIADYVPDDAEHSLTDDGRERLDIRVSHVHGLKRLISGLAGVVTVVAPEEARGAVREWAEAGRARYGGRPAGPSSGDSWDAG